ncbi:hypothetical protein V501_03633 [Pseudogymnoascus sp. VKM F-4519 (FW-2642)]|nr:hypothetical protein V501_03633 [Pseudogymnoascus sp. VKM F-4519 (FW-2642)]
MQEPQQQQQAHVTRRGPSLQENRNVKPARHRASRAGTRCVSKLSAAQLARKRAIDRESQRVSRERTKENIENFERQIEEQRLYIEWMKQRYSQLESEMRAQGAVMTLMLNATPSNHSNDYSGLDVLCMPQNIYDNVGNMRWVDSSDTTEEMKASGADFTPGYSPLNVSFSTLPVFE